MKKCYLSAMLLMACSSAALALPTSVSLSLTSGSNSETLAATGFDNAYNLDTTDTGPVNGVTTPAFSAGPTGLTMITLPGDIYGQYGTTTTNTADNVFYSGLDPDGAGGTTTETVDMTISNLNQNYHGAGIWMGMDENHYVRVGLIANSGPPNPDANGNTTAPNSIMVEALRENMDLWTGAPVDPGTGGDIVDQQITDNLGSIPETGSVSVILKLVRTGTTAQASISTDGGTTFTNVGPAFTNIDTVASQVNNPSTDGNDVPEEFKVGVYAFGGSGSDDAEATFSNFSAVSLPEPALGLVLLGLPMLRRRKAV